jgi:hypothetical protein
MSGELVRIAVRKVQAPVDALLAPDAREWEGIAEVVVSVEPTPVDRQPSVYVQAAWRVRPRSVLRDVRVRAAARDEESTGPGSGLAVAGGYGCSVHGDGGGDRNDGADRGAWCVGSVALVGGSLAGGAGGSARQRRTPAEAGPGIAGGLWRVVRLGTGACWFEGLLTATL